MDSFEPASFCFLSERGTTELPLIVPILLYIIDYSIIFSYTVGTIIFKHFV